jgi:hypothetical protein
VEKPNSSKRWIISNKLLFWLLKLTVIYFLGSILFSFWEKFNFPFFLSGIILFGVLVSGFKYADEVHLVADKKGDWKIAVYALLANTAGALLTFWASQDLGFGPVIASAVVGLVGSLLLPKVSAEIYTGSFVGMCSIGIAPHFSRLLMAGMFAGLIFYTSRHVLIGFGGKLGTIAFTSVILATLMVGARLPSPAPQTSEFTWAIVLSAALAAGLTWLIADYKKLGAVCASSIVGFLGGFALPLFLPMAGSDHATAVFCASFVGMVSRERMPKLWMVLLAGTVAGLIFQFSDSLFGGIGGKLGTIALASVLSLWGYNAMLLKWISAKADPSSGS